MVAKEYVECPKCKKVFSRLYEHNDGVCPHCGSEWWIFCSNPVNISIEEAHRPWYTENWYEEDLEAAMEAAGVEVTRENLDNMKEACRSIFDDKTERNEILADKAYELFRRTE